MSNAVKKPDALQVYAVPPEYLIIAWPDTERILQRVVKPDTGYALNDVLNELQLGTMQLWVIGDFKGVVVTTVNVKPLHKVLWVQFLAGDHMDDWLDEWIQTQEAYAKHNDCVAIEFNGRKGWSKMQKHHSDYKPVTTIYRRAL